MDLCKTSIKRRGKLKKQKAYHAIISDSLAGSFGWMSQTSDTPGNGLWDGSR